MWTSRDVSGAALEIAQTEVGQNRTVRLPDGSQVTLGGDTLLRASFNATSRHVELTRGEALFDVAKDRTRPFSVDTGTATVTAIGTQFNVRRREERVDIAVVDGAVVVEPLRQQTEGAEQFAHLPSHEAAAAGRRPQHEALRLMAGERAVVGSAGVRAGATFAAADAPIAWRSGRLVFEREPLREVVQDVNRYSRKPLALEDEGIGGLLFTGTVVNGNVEGWIASIQQVFSLDAVEQPDRIVLRRRAH
jgi:transmembrane sensor